MRYKAAVKIYKRSSTYRDNQAREVATLSILDHPSILHIYGCIQSDSHIYVAFDRQPINLAEYLAKKGVPLIRRFAREIARQICSALAYCHAHFIVHLSLDATKILVHKDGKVKLCGFGHSVLKNGWLLNTDFRERGVLEQFREERSKRSMPAPELLSKKASANLYDCFKVDVWAFGMVIWSTQFTEKPPDTGFKGTDFRILEKDYESSK